MKWTQIAGIFGCTGVILGAFGAHALKAKLSLEMLSIWHTAVLYHLLHSVVLLALALYAEVSKKEIRWCAGMFTTGILLFSGSLYIMCLTGIKWMGAITPIGGGFLIAGWVCVTLKTKQAT